MSGRERVDFAVLFVPGGEGGRETRVVEKKKKVRGIEGTEDSSVP